MTETTAPATTPAASGGTEIDYDKLGQAVAKHVGASFGEHLKPLSEQIGKLQTSPATAPAAGADPNAPKYLTAEEMNQALDLREKARMANLAKSEARQKVINAKLKDVPSEFLSHLPDTDNEAELNTAADKIITRVNEAIKIKQPNLGGASADGGAPLAGGGAARTPIRGLTDAQSAFASSLTIPGKKA